MAKKSTTNGYRLVYVLWQDSCGASARWQFLDESDPERVVCSSVGWLVYDGKDCKRIVPHLVTPEDGRSQGCGDMTIPTSAIRKLVTLKTPA